MDAKSAIEQWGISLEEVGTWEHHLALTILAAWFIAETRLDWMQRLQQDPALFT